MNTNFKKLAAAFSAAVIACTFTACMDNGSLMTVDGTEIRNGVYISYLTNFTNTAQSKISEESSANSTDSTDSESETDFWSATIDGKDVTEWIKENTLKSVRGHIGVQRLCEKYGISLTDEELTEINTQCDKEWESSNIYAKYVYGFDTVGEMNEARGVGIESYKEIVRVNMLRNKLFLHYYDTDGEQAVSDEEYNKFIDENYAAIRIMSLPYKDYMGNELTAESDIKAIKDKAQEYADKLNDGERYETIRYLYELAKAQDEARKKASTEYSEEVAGGLSPDEYIEKAANEATYTVPDDASLFNMAFSKANSSYNTEVTNFIMSLARDGKPYVFHSDEAKTSYVVVRMEMSVLENWKESNRESVLQQMRGDAFNELIEQASADYEVQQDNYLVNTKYTPKKVSEYVKPAY
ncbi:MAG: hypothetical protein K2N06_09850 [Oscillospiraceae bacterium]|nr:hypothetical protein [Oscillospiraceae bacterium]